MAIKGKEHIPTFYRHRSVRRCAAGYLSIPLRTLTDIMQSLIQADYFVRGFDRCSGIFILHIMIKLSKVLDKFSCFLKLGLCDFVVLENSRWNLFGQSSKNTALYHFNLTNKLFLNLNIILFHWILKKNSRNEPNLVIMSRNLILIFKARASKDRSK